MDKYDEDRNVCAYCGEELYEHGYEIDGDWACDECFWDYVSKLNPVELAKALGLLVKCII